MRRVVCAAIRAADGGVLVGIRHYSADMHEQMAQRVDEWRWRHRQGDEQGFVDQFGVYMTRAEAYEVAQAAGQITDPGACRDGQLFSEGLY